MDNPLHTSFPTLKKLLPTQGITDLPTPVSRLTSFGDHFDHPQVYIKRDDQSGLHFGGNKVRALDFLLPHAHRDGGNYVMGLPGANMALAANIYARAAKIPLKTFLGRQRPTKEAQRNLLYFQYLDANMKCLASMDEIQAGFAGAAAETQREFGREPFILNPSSPLGMCGYINAAFELKHQVLAGKVPEPDWIYLPLGLLGTSTGLCLGLKAAGLKTRVVSIYNAPADKPQVDAAYENIAQLFGHMKHFLRNLAPAFPDVEFEPADIDIRAVSKGGMKNRLDHARAWLTRFAEMGDVPLEMTWTAQAVAELAADLTARKLHNSTVLFWYTTNTRPYPEALDHLDYRTLPAEFHEYFETDVFSEVNKPIWM